MAWNPPPNSPPAGAGAAAGVAPALAPEVVAPNKPPAGAVVVVGDANKPADAGGFAPPPNRFAGPVEAGVEPKENPPGFVVAAPPPPPKRPPEGCLLSAVAPAAGWPKRLGEGAPVDAGVEDCPKRLPPVPPGAPKLKDPDILGEFVR